MGRPGHVHGLGVDPGDGALMVATHNGLFRLPEGAARPVRVGESREDFMGFTVAGPGRYLASGHPGAGKEVPQPLGLIETDDGGRSWRPVSLQGEADFHVLRLADGVLYGFDVMGGRLLASSDGGRRWERRAAPGAPIDLAASPAASERLVASTADGLYASARGGRGWSRLAGGAPGLLAWPSERRLYLVDGAGGVHVSEDGGGEWEAIGSIGSMPAALTAVDRNTLYAALADGSILVSGDGGRSWRGRAAP